MVKRLLTFSLSLIMVFSIFSCVPLLEASAEELVTSENGIAFIKSLEGFSKYPIWDYSQYSVGYGSSAKNENDLKRWFNTGITEEEADALMREHLKDIEAAVNQFSTDNNLSLSQNQFDALVSFSYNCGTKWMTTSGNFRASVIEGKSGNEFLCAIVSWCHAGNTILTGLINRRLCEGNLYLNGIYSTSVPTNYSYVFYNARGGLCGTQIQAFDNNNPLQETELPKPTKTGCTFSGWYDSSYTGTKITAVGAEYNMKTLFAGWGDISSASAESLSDESETSADMITVAVTGDVVNVRSGKGTGYNVTRTVCRGTTLQIAEVSIVNGSYWGRISSGEWICLTYSDYKPSASTDDTELNEQETVVIEAESPLMTVIVTGSSVNIRSAAGTGNSVVGVSKKGNSYSISEVQKVGDIPWGKIIGSGWICLSYTDYQSQLNIQAAQENQASTQSTENTIVEQDTDGEKQSEGVSIDTSSESKDSQESSVEQESEETIPDIISTEVSVKVTGSALNVREGPGTSYKALSLVRRGETLSVKETKIVNDTYWGRISDTGWVCLTYTSYSAGNESQDSTESRKTSDSTEQSAQNDTEESQSVSLQGKVTASSLNIRKGAGSGYPVVGGLSRGTIVTILEKKTVNGTVWGKISGGWISLSYVSFSDSSSQSSTSETSEGIKYKVTGNVVNIRKDSSLTAGVIRSAYRGNILTITETVITGSYTWGHIQGSGWICMAYLQKV